MDERRIIAVPRIVAVPAPLRVKVRLAHSSNFARTPTEKSNVCLHATHGAEGPNKDDDEAAQLQKPDHGVSFHYVVDSNSATRCVPDLYVAWHARRTANARCLGVELCGRADQSRDQWFDAVSLATLNIAARLVADICKEHKIPAEFCGPDELRAGKRGITTHEACSKAWKESDHWDPGPHFPLTEFIAAVKVALTVV